MKNKIKYSSGIDHHFLRHPRETLVTMIASCAYCDLTEESKDCIVKAVAISPSTAICPWNLFCRDHSRVFI